MTDDERDLVPMVPEELLGLAEAASDIQKDLDAIEAEIVIVAELLQQYAPERDLALDFLNCFGKLGPTKH